MLLRQIARNARQEGSVVLNKVLAGDGDYGYNAQTEVSGLMLTTEAMIAEKPKKKKDPAMPAGGIGEDMY